jgi:hypothetical protein
MATKTSFQAVTVELVGSANAERNSQPASAVFTYRALGATYAAVTAHRMVRMPMSVPFAS